MYMNIIRLSAYTQTISGILLILGGIFPVGFPPIIIGSVLTLSIPVYYFSILLWLKSVDKNSEPDFGMVRVSTAFVAWIPFLGPIITYPFVYLNYKHYAS